MFDKAVADKYIDTETVFKTMDDIKTTFIFSPWGRYFTPDMGEAYFNILIDKNEIGDAIKEGGAPPFSPWHIHEVHKKEVQ